MTSSNFIIDDNLTDFAMRNFFSQEKTYVLDDDLTVIKDVIRSKLTAFISMPITARLQKVADLFTALQ